jgi:ligand-binding SRPBCC domain-containing protein
LDKAWDFISKPENLKMITPPDLGFEIINKSAVGTMYEGLIIHYRLKPLWGISVNWVSKIPHFEPKRYFVDEQKFGPYKFWHHQHFLHPIDNGVEMIDIIHYKLPFGFLGDLAHTLFIKRKLHKIFEFRRSKLEERFGILPN